MWNLLPVSDSPVQLPAQPDRLLVLRLPVVVQVLEKVPRLNRDPRELRIGDLTFLPVQSTCSKRMNFIEDLPMLLASQDVFLPALVNQDVEFWTSLSGGIGELIQ